MSLDPSDFSPLEGDADGLIKHFMINMTVKYTYAYTETFEKIVLL